MSIQLSQYYNQAVERAKQMIMDDINHYMEPKETIPSFEQYVRERGQFIEQIWLNAWLNTAVHASISEKKAYLVEHGFEVEDVGKKLLNKLFRTEIRNVHPYDLLGWLEETYAKHPDEWQKSIKPQETITKLELRSKWIEKPSENLFSS